MVVRSTVIVFAAAVTLAGCASQEPFEYHAASEIPEGPGLVSGEDGAFVLYSSDQAGMGAREPVPAPADQDRFRAFQDWKREAKGTKEYREFQDWLEWKAYRRWRNQKAD